MKTLGKKPPCKETLSLAGKTRLVTTLLRSRVNAIVLYLELNFLHKLHYIIRKVFLVRNWIATDFLRWRVAGVMSGPRRHLPPKNETRPERHLGGGHESHNCHTEAILLVQI